MKCRPLLVACLIAATVCTCIYASDGSAAEGDSQYVAYEGPTYGFTKNSSGSQFWSDLVSYNGTETFLMVQASLEGYPLETIGASAFGDAAVESAVIPPTVREIGTGAFSGCGSFGDVYFLGGMPILGDSALGGATVHYLQKHSASWEAYTGSKAVIEQSVSGSVLYLLIDGRAYAGGNEGGRDIIIADSTTIGGSEYPVAAVLPYSFFADEGIESVTVSEGVTVIEERAFMYCRNLSALSLPSTLRVIDAEAFRMGIPSSEGDGSLSSLTELTLPDGLEYVGFECFRMTFHLRNITVPDSVTRYCEGAFRACYNLERVSLGAGIGEIPQWSFDNCYSLKTVTAGARISSVGASAFYGDRSLEVLDFPEGGPDAAGASAFSGCKALAAFPSGSLSSVGPGAFRDCASMRAIDLPASVAIGDAAFCASGLESISLEGDVSIGRGVFSKCSALKGIDVKGSPRYSSVDGVLYEGKTLMCFPIGKECREFFIPVITEAIGTEAFTDSKITVLDVPDSVREIGERAFAGSGLREVSIGNGLTSLGDRAFYGCGDLGFVHFKGNAPVFGAHVFGGAPEGFIVYYNHPNADSWLDSGISAMYRLSEWKEETSGGLDIVVISAAVLTAMVILIIAAMAWKRRM